MPLLEYEIHFHLFRDHGRLNPEVPLEKAGDCGANTLFLLGLIDLPEATALSTIQNKCWSERHIRMGKETTPRYVFSKYVFKSNSNKNELIESTKEDLLREVQKLKPGLGTFLFMKDSETNLGHSSCIYKNIDTGEIEIADLQTEEIISNDFEPDRLDEYLSHYDLFYIPGTVDAPSVRSKSVDLLSDTHGSPAKIIPEAHYESPVRRGTPASESPVKIPEAHYESPVRRGTPASFRTPESENTSERPDSFQSHEKVRRSPARSPLPPPKKSRSGGTRRKRRTRRKN